MSVGDFKSAGFGMPLSESRSPELRRVLDAHVAWLNHVPGGAQANFSGATLNDAELDGVNLSRALFRSAFLLEANLSGADLSGAVLDRVDLRRASLPHAD